MIGKLMIQPSSSIPMDQTQFLHSAERGTVPSDIEISRRIFNT